MSQLVYCAGKKTYTNTQHTKYKQIHVGNFGEIWLQWMLVHLEHESYFRHQSGQRSNIFFNFRFVLRTIFQDGCTTSREKGEGSSQVRKPKNQKDNKQTGDKQTKTNKGTTVMLPLAENKITSVTQVDQTNAVSFDWCRMNSILFLKQIYRQNYDALIFVFQIHFK